MGDRGQTWAEKMGLLCPFGAELGPGLTQCGLGRGLLLYQVVSSSIQLLGHNRHEPKTGGLMHPAVSPQEKWAENRGALPTVLGRGAGSPFSTMWPGPRPTFHAKCHLDPCSHLAATDMGRKLADCAPLGVRELGPHLTQCGQGRGLPACQVSS